MDLVSGHTSCTRLHGTNQLTDNAALGQAGQPFALVLSFHDHRVVGTLAPAGAAVTLDVSPQLFMHASQSHLIE